jgi:hypothetical protein
MNKDEKNKVIADGKTILRAQHDKTNRWKIVKQTRVNKNNPTVTGWCRFGGEWYITRDDADKAIEKITKNYSPFYIHDK